VTDEEHKEIVLRIGRAFMELPDDRDRFDILGALAGIMEKRVRAGSMEESWAITATGALKGIVKIWTGSTAKETK